MAMRMLPALMLITLLTGPLFAAGRPITVDDLLAVKGVSDPRLSPDGKLVVYVVSEIDRAANKSNSSLWIVPLDGGESRRMTTTPGSNTHPRWAPDGKSIAFVSDRGGSSQIWLLSLEGGEPRQLTKLPIDVSGPIWSPQGDRLAFVAQVYPDTTPEATAERDKQQAEAKSKAKVFDHLMIRHWTAWDDGKRSHLFVCDAKTGAATDLTPTWKANIPPAPFGGSSDYAWSPDGSELAFTSEPLKDMAWSTNSDIWAVPAQGGTARNLTEKNLGGDAQPAYSPDGALLAHVAQARAGFEADQWVLTLQDLRPGGATTALPKLFDRPIGSFRFASTGTRPQSRWTLFAVIDSEGTEPVMRIDLRDAGGGAIVADPPPREVISGGVTAALDVSPDAKQLVLLQHTADRPAEIFRANADGNGRTQITHHNDSLIAQLDLPKLERFDFPGAGGDSVQGWLLRPPGFDPSKKYPVLFLIHGGPQGAFHDEWHNRWNYQLFGAPGYAIVTINPRGSTGFGQKFTDAISKDWNGKVYEDLMLGLDHALKTFPFLDAGRVAAAGGSYGGYMVNWIAGHTDRFRCLISHAGIFDLVSMNITTEELWFSEWEFGGMPWDTLERQTAQSPSTFAGRFKTPTLVLHGALDFRVPDAQGLAMFTALQRRGVPSRYVFFPDEGHWIAKPANRVLWWREVHNWLGKYLAGGNG